METKETLACIVAVALLLYSLTGFALIRKEIRELELTAAEAEKALSALEKENKTLRQRIEQGCSDEEMQRLARERLGLALPGEKIFYFQTDREEHPWNWQSAQY